MSSFLPSHFQQAILNKNNNNMVIGIVLFISFLLIFFFRDQISQFKEILKAKVRSTLKPMFFKVENGTIYSSEEGTMHFIWNYLDTYFLAPSEAGETGIYDYLPSDDDEVIETVEPFSKPNDNNSKEEQEEDDDDEEVDDEEETDAEEDADEQ